MLLWTIRPYQVQYRGLCSIEFTDLEADEEPFHVQTMNACNLTFAKISKRL